jgi:hypothetical protein
MLFSLLGSLVRGMSRIAEDSRHNGIDIYEEALLGAKRNIAASAASCSHGPGSNPYPDAHDKMPTMDSEIAAFN